jgi:hypothetical protein
MDNSRWDRRRAHRPRGQAHAASDRPTVPARAPPNWEILRDDGNLHGSTWGIIELDESGFLKDSLELAADYLP